MVFTSRFESLAQAFFTEEFRACKDHLRHKTSMISPLQIQKAGIAYTTCVQARITIVFSYCISLVVIVVL